MASNLQDQLFEAAKAGYWITFSYTEGNQLRITIRNHDVSKCKDSVLEVYELDEAYIHLRRLCR